VTDLPQLVPVPPGYSVDIVWENKPEALLNEIVEFWLANKALPNKETALERAPQVAVIVRDEAGAIAGLSTVYQQVHPRFGVSFNYMRAFVTEAHRRTMLATLLVFEVARYFQKRFKEGHNPEVIGVYMEIQNEAVNKTMNQAVWPYLPFFFAGKTQRGAFERIFYFEGAKI
jgi:hypothetical protein